MGVRELQPLIRPGAVRIGATSSNGARGPVRVQEHQRLSGDRGLNTDSSADPSPTRCRAPAPSGATVTPYLTNSASIAAQAATTVSNGSFGATIPARSLVTYVVGSGSGGGGGTGGGEIHAVGSGKCLDVPTTAPPPGTQLDIWDCNGGSNQIWTSTSSNQLTVYSGSSQLCLDAYGHQTTPGTKVDIWTCNGGANQQWNVNSNGTITGVQSGLCLDVTGASTADGALVELWTCNGGSNQQWTLG